MVEPDVNRIRRRWRIIVPALFLPVLAVVLFWFFRPSEARPNVILICIDSLRSDHLGCYGYSRDTSPTLDRFAGEGALFETVVSSTSWTLPAHAALFTGLPDSVHGCFDHYLWLDGSRKTIAEAFQEAGFKTVGFFSGPYLHPFFGLSQGFDMYYDCTSYAEKSIDVLKSKENVETVVDLSLRDITNPVVLDKVTRWLDLNQEGPFFMFIHLWDVHLDYIPPPPHDTMFDPDYRGVVDGRFRRNGDPDSWSKRDLEHFKALYDGEIRWTDETLGKLFDTLKARGDLEDTVIAVTSDHGDAFLEHGVLGHKNNLHEEEIRIPLLIRYPPTVPAGVRVRRLVHIMDVAPTLLGLAGRAPLPHALGKDLTPLIRNPAAPWPGTPSVSELMTPMKGQPVFALRTEEWKMIKTRDGTLEVFDLKRDPGEQSPLREKEYPISLQALLDLYKTTTKELEAACLRLPIPGKRDTPDIPEITEAHLRSLGYLK